MRKLDLEKYGEDLKQALSLAARLEVENNEKFRRQDVDGKDYIVCDLSSIDVDDLVAKGTERELMDFLAERDYELTKILCILMWVGRDSTFQENDGTYDYSKIRESCDRNGWATDKLGQIDYLIGKMKLFTCFQKGLQKLNIHL